jgi:hypothetical protein
MDSLIESKAEVASSNIVYGATRLANAHDFITKLPDGYDTLVGEAGVLLKIVVANNVGDCWTSEICCLSQFGLNSESL